MQTYKVHVSRDDHGYIIVAAGSEDEAREKIESGDWEDKDYTVKNGGCSVEGVELLD